MKTNVMISLTWNSREGESFIAKYSTDMIDWNNGVAADAGDTTTRRFDISSLSAVNPNLHLQIEKQ